MFNSILILIFMNLLWSGTYVAVKLGLESMHPLTIVFWRMGISVAVLTVWLLFKRIPLRVDKKGLFQMIMLGTVTAGAHILWVTGLKYTTASDASLLYTFEPIWAIVLASIFLKEKFCFAMGLGLIFAFIGLVILSNISLFTINSLFGASVAFGNLLVVLGLFCESSFSVIAKPLADRYSPFVVITGALLVAELVLAGPTAAIGGFAFPLTIRNVSVILFLSIPCTVVGYVFWVHLMRRLPVNVMCYTIFVQPVAGPIIAMVVLGEVLDSRILSGGIFLLAGVAIVVASHIKTHRAVIANEVKQSLEFTT